MEWLRWAIALPVLLAVWGALNDIRRALLKYSAAPGANLAEYRAQVVHSVSCPACNAPAGELCSSLDSANAVTYVHDDRSLAYDRQVHA